MSDIFFAFFIGRSALLGLTRVNESRQVLKIFPTPCTLKYQLILNNYLIRDGKVNALKVGVIF